MILSSSTSRFLAGWLLSSAVFGVSANAQSTNSTDVASTNATSAAGFSWTKITATPDIEWHDCFDGFLCARLQVPLDWTAPNSSSHAEIAITALPPSVPTNSSQYSGPLLMNPGGPGGSGVLDILVQGKKFHQIVGTTHTLIGFDPRGINNTTPGGNCFNSALSRLAWQLQGNRASNPATIPDEAARWSSVWGQCAQRGVGKYVSTPNVARDMLAISEKVWNSAGYKGCEKGLRYWGFSYGTALGMTFANLFPDRVDRIVLDGVVDIEDWYTNARMHFMVDADKVIDRFFYYCSKAGKACAFTAPTPDGVKTRLRNLKKKLEASPMPVYNQTEPDWISLSDVFLTLFNNLLIPLVQWPSLAVDLAALEAGNSSTIRPASVGASSGISTDTGPIVPGEDATAAIFCSDAEPFRKDVPTIPELKEHYYQLVKQSEWTGSPWSGGKVQCSGWRQPPLGVQAPKKWGAKTSNPILFVNNELDPRCPVKNARAMRKLYPGAGLVSAKGGIGHCSYAVESACNLKNINKYFKDGKVEKDEVVCEVDLQPFEGLPTPISGKIA
ncbi:TAP-like protein-domain-containing protein [Geopyxis carbonaria]|nr:TAP-like protein-domain-containing protein [Geopyxis carbonaria]